MVVVSGLLAMGGGFRMSLNEPVYRPQLDGVRAFCILFTVSNHTPGMPAWINGSVGVDVFFALSGWLITWLLMRERHETSSINLMAFYIRRIFRILPLYFLTICIYSCASALMLMLNDHEDWENLKSALPYLLTFNSEYRSDAAGDIFGHAWTLGIEEKFYIVWPFALLIAGRRLWPAFVVAFFVSAALIWIDDGSGFTLRGYVGLGFGATLAVATHQWARLTEILCKPGSSYLGLVLFVLAYIGSIAAPHPLAWNLAVSLSSALFIGALWHNGSSVLARLLSWRPIEFAGKLTYGMYLLHVLALNVIVLVFARGMESTPAPIVVLAASYSATLLGAYVLHLVVERPLIKIGRKIASRASARVVSERATV